MNSAQKPVPTPDQARDLIAALEGVVSAHVVTGPGGRIVEIHVLASASLHPKQVVRNVESALTAGLGIGIDRRVVSVAQVRPHGDAESGEEGEAGGERPAEGGPVLSAESGGAATGAPAGPRPWRAPEREAASSGAPVERAAASTEAARGRLEYVRYECRREGGSCACEVVLREGAEEIRGVGGGPDTTPGRAEAAGRAVMDAIGRARPELRLALEGAVLSRSRGREYVIVVAHALQDRATVALSGAAPIARSPEEAAILAALQATNRWSG